MTWCLLELLWGGSPQSKPFSRPRQPQPCPAANSLYLPHSAASAAPVLQPHMHTYCAACPLHQAGSAAFSALLACSQMYLSYLHSGQGAQASASLVQHIDRPAACVCETQSHWTCSKHLCESQYLNCPRGVLEGGSPTLHCCGGNACRTATFWDAKQRTTVTTASLFASIQVPVVALFPLVVVVERFQS